ncbi:hypothetical protein D3C73_976450 [compost metagenome]
MRAAVAVAQPPLLVVDLDDGRTHMQLAGAFTRLVQHREQRAPLHAQAMQARIQAVIAHVHHRAFARGIAIQPAHRHGVATHGIEQAHLPQHLQSAGLQQEPCAHRPWRRHAFEDLHLVAITGEQDGQCLASGAVSNYGDAQSFRHARIVPSAQGWYIDRLLFRADLHRAPPPLPALLRMSPGSLYAAASSFTSQESRQWWRRSAFMASVGARAIPQRERLSLRAK